MQNYWAIAIRRYFSAKRLTVPFEAAIEFDLMMPLLSRWQFRIEWGHCDPAGIVFNSRFFEFFDWGTWTLFEKALGVRPPALAETFGIIGLPLVDSGARFLAPVRFGDVVILTSRAGEFRSARFDVEHRLMVGEVLAVEGRETRVWATSDPADASRIKPLAVPEHIVARFQA
jgi:4-hydroxybenzoyl-CoA thioesterase